ncbi:MAG TPA: glycosyltransferase [Streptosporangiaceae bacterium]|nr:glycosyltransferase [Streptosporangiaceae bacterium]
MSSVSVVIPCYKYGHFLPDAISSALTDQPGVDVRVLVIDDASADGSAEVARRIAASDARVQVTEHVTNRGHIATYNEGLLDWADGDYTVLLSADDRLTPGALRRAADLLDAHPGAGFAYGHPVRFQDGTRLPAARTAVRGWSVWPGHWWLERRFRDSASCISSPEVMVRTSLQQQVGGYDPRLPHTGDTEMWLRLAAHADVGYVRGADQAFYRVHGQNMTRSRTPLVDLRQRRLAYEAVLERCADQLPDAASLSDVVHRRLGREALWSAARAYDRGRTEQTPVDELIVFAFDCWPEAKRLPVYRGLQLREWLGPRVMPYLQPFVLSAVGRKAQEWWWWQSWARRGL